jgi:hypothetical protein
MFDKNPTGTVPVLEQDDGFILPSRAQSWSLSGASGVDGTHPARAGASCPWLSQGLASLGVILSTSSLMVEARQTSAL